MNIQEPAPKCKIWANTAVADQLTSADESPKLY